MQGIDQEDQMREGKLCIVGGEMGKDGEQEASWKTIKGRDSGAGSEMERKGSLPTGTVMC